MCFEMWCGDGDTAGNVTGLLGLKLVSLARIGTKGLGGAYDLGWLFHGGPELINWLMIYL